MTYEELVCRRIDSAELAQAMLDCDVRTRVVNSAAIDNEGEHRARIMPIVAAYAAGYSLSLRDGEYAPIATGDGFWFDTAPHGGPTNRGFANLPLYEHCLTYPTLYTTCPRHVVSMRGMSAVSVIGIADKVFLRPPEVA